MKVTKSKKTSLVRKTAKPAFNQSFDLSLEESNLTTSFISLEFKQAQAFGVKGMFLGSLNFIIVLTLYRCESWEGKHGVRHVRQGVGLDPVGASHLAPEGENTAVAHACQAKGRDQF